MAWAHTARFSFVEVDGESLLYDTESHDVVHLDRSGSLVWGLCDGTRDTESITALLCAAYPDARSQITADVERTLQTLRALGSLHEVEVAHE